MAAMQAVYPTNILFTADDIKNGASVLYLIGKLLWFLFVQELCTVSLESSWRPKTT